MLSPVRPTSSGLWYVNDEGRGALLLDASLVEAEATRARLVRAILDVRAANLDGLLATTDLVADGANLWLLTDNPIRPCLADLLADRGLASEGPCAVAVLLDIATTLSQLHAANLVHGALAPDSVIIDSHGRALLAEPAISAALSGRTPSPGDDVLAWATVARTLGSIWSRAHEQIWHTVVASSAIAEAAGLGEAVARLEAATSEPELATARQWLMRAAAPEHSDAANAAIPAAAGIAAADDHHAGRAVETAPGALAISNAAATQLGQRSGLGVAAGTVPPGAVPAPRAAPAASGAEAADHNPTSAMRFGPGIPVTTQPRLSEGSTEVPRRRAIGRRRVRSVVATAAVIAVVVGWLWWRSGVALSVHEVALQATVPPGSRCNVTVDIAALVSVTGTGQLSYQWVRNDGETSAVLTHTVWPGQHNTRVHLYWEFSGTGHYDATVTLKVLHPAGAAGNTRFTYECP